MSPVLQARGLRKRYGATEVLRGVDLSVRAGERLALIGPNGAGKSTLFKLLAGEQRCSAGQVWLHGRRIDGLPPQRISQLGLARGFQHSSHFPRLSVLDNLLCALLWPLGYRQAFWRRLSQAHDARAQAEAMLERVGLQARRDWPAGQLSYAEQRALELGMSFAGGAGVVLLDEPTAGMSREETQRCMALIRSLSAGRTLLMVEHDMNVVFGLAERVAVLVEGELLACASPEEVRADPRVQRAYLGAPA